MHPHKTEMDLSISMALYFAARGQGQFDATCFETPPATCATTSRILLSGFGADELFAGYRRHATAYHERGPSALLDELELDFVRMPERNLGRDDRVISDSGREARLPFLDEDVVAFAMAQPLWDKCGFGDDTPDADLGPEKRVLRLVAKNIGLRDVASQPKRAVGFQAHIELGSCFKIQFGARTAKMRTGRTRGNDIIS